ncbi:MAG: hypothetical protein ABIH42_01015 [Planctomycetota bacterium]
MTRIFVLVASLSIVLGASGVLYAAEGEQAPTTKIQCISDFFKSKFFQSDSGGDWWDTTEDTPPEETKPPEEEPVITKEPVEEDITEESMFGTRKYEGWSDFSVKFKLYSLMQYADYDGGADSFNLNGNYLLVNANCNNTAFSGLIDPFLDSPFIWGYIDWVPFYGNAVDAAKVKEKVRFRFGQFAVPFGLNQQEAPYSLDTIYYSQITQATCVETNKNGLYDVGMMIHGRFTLKNNLDIYYQCAALNGEYADAPGDSDNRKAVCGRFGLIFQDRLNFGLSYYDGSRAADSIFPHLVQRRRIGGDVKLQIDKFLFAWEYISAKDNPDGHREGTTWVGRQDIGTEGMYLQVGYMCYTDKRISADEPRGIMAIAKCDMLDLPPNADMYLYTGHYHRKKFIYGVGLNWDISVTCRLQILYEHFDFGQYYTGKFSGVESGSNDDRLTMQMVLSLF